MATATELMAEDGFLCSICLHIFIKPVTIPCGHNFCLDCITKYWHTLHTVFMCPLCKTDFNSRPMLQVNCFIAQMTENVKKSVQKSVKSRDHKDPNELSGCQQCEQHAWEHKHRLTEMDTFYKEKLNEARLALKQKEEELKSVRNSVTEIETFYKEKLCEARSALRHKEEEMKAADRLAPDDAVLTKKRGPDGMKHPLGKASLTGMYHELKLLRWPKIKDQLKSNNITPEFTKGLIQKMFNDAKYEMKRKKEQIEEVFGLIESSSGQTSQKVMEHKQLAFHNLQMFLYHRGKGDLLKTPLPGHEGQYSSDMMDKLRLLASECYWLGCLMALNNPPLQLGWQNHVPGMDPWDIFPRDIETFSTD